jgi:tryptophan synthase alpha chain
MSNATGINTNGIGGAFSKTEKENRGAFIPYLTAGYPDPDTFLEIAQALADNGADVIEIGLPFSDPQADGPVIQKSSKAALDIGINSDRVLELATRVRERVSTPLVIMSYYNPILQMGHETFARRASEAGVNGVIIPDLTPEESEEWLSAADEYNLDTIFMIAPTTPLARKKEILKVAKGFVYYVSLTGVTGAALGVSDELMKDIRDLKALTSLPVAVGFGVSGPEQAAPLSQAADGVIVGTALIREVMKHTNPRDQVRAVTDLAASIRQAVESPAGESAMREAS